MKKLAILVILIFLVSILPVHAKGFGEMKDEDYDEIYYGDGEDEEEEDDADDGAEFGKGFQKKVKKIKAMADKMKELAEKFGDMELDIIKKEVVNVWDQEGNPVDCNFEIYYDSDYVITLDTKNGHFDGDFNHYKNYPGRAISININKCPCRIKEIKHKVSFPQFDETIERMKELVKDELISEGEDKAKELGKKAVKKAFDMADARHLAGPFLWGLEKGMELGEPFGEALTNGLNDILRITRAKNREYRDLFKGDKDWELTPATNRRTTERLWNWGRTKPQIQNSWDIAVVCSDSISTTSDWSFQDPRQFMPKPPKTKPAVTTGGGTWTKKKQKEYDDYWKEQERIREQEYEKERKRMEAEMKKAAEEAKKNREAAVRKVKDECKPCDPIRAEIAAKEKEIEAKSDEIAQKESALQEAKDKVKDAEEKAKDAQAKKDAYNGPGDYVEDPKTGKRVTSQDLAINKMVAQNSWQEYVNGDITAQELEEKWKNFDEEELAKAKKDYEESLDKAITDAEAGVEAAKKAVSDADLAVQHAEGDKTLLEDDLAELYKKLDDCLRLCEKYASWIAEETWGTEKAIGYDDLVSKEKPKTTPKPVTVTKPKAAVTTPKTEPTGPCKTGEFLNDARCSNSCKPNEKCEWYRTVEEGTCTGCTATCEAGEYYNSQSKCEDDCDGDCTRRFRTDCWVCGEAAAATEGPKNCDEYCATFGDYTGVKPDWKSYIMSEIADVTCKSRVNLVFPGGIEVGECKCYTNSKPSISFGPDIVCQDTSCGDVACGSSAQCSCGTNCIQIVNCNWGGWKWEGDANTGGPVPQLAVQNQ